MRSKVVLKEHALNYFRQMARDSKVEIQAYLIGEVVSPQLAVIDSFEYTQNYGTQTKSSVAWYTSEYERVRLKAEERGRRIIGFIHSHPEWDSVMSEADFDVCIRDGFRLCGTVSTNGRKTRVRFWVTDSPIPCKWVYAKTKRD